MKYTLGNKKYWLGWLKKDLNRWYYKTFYGFNMDSFNGTMLPQTGKGRFVSVYSKGKIIQIVQEQAGKELLGKELDEIRIIPCQYNHGIMVETLKDGKLKERMHLDINKLNNRLIYASNIEQLTSKNKQIHVLNDETIKLVIDGIANGDLLVGYNNTELTPEQREQYKTLRLERLNNMSIEEKERIDKFVEKLRQDDSTYGNPK